MSNMQDWFKILQCASYECFKGQIFIFEQCFFFQSFSFCIIDNYPKNNVALNGNQCLSTCPKTKKYL